MCRGMEPGKAEPSFPLFGVRSYRTPNVQVQPSTASTNTLDTNTGDSALWAGPVPVSIYDSAEGVGVEYSNLSSPLCSRTKAASRSASVPSCLERTPMGESQVVNRRGLPQQWGNPLTAERLD